MDQSIGQTEPRAFAPEPRGFGPVLAFVAGWMLVLLGIVFLVAPGPGIPILVAGLALLGRRPKRTTESR